MCLGGFYRRYQWISTDDLHEPDEDPRRFGVWPAKKDVVVTEQQYVLPVRPNLVVAKRSSTKNSNIQCRKF